MPSPIRACAVLVILVLLGACTPPPPPPVGDAVPPAGPEAIEGDY